MICLNLKNERFILLNEDQRVRKIVNKLFDEYSISPEEIMEIQQSTTGFAMAVAGMGVTLLLKVLLNLIIMQIILYITKWEQKKVQAEKCV